MNENASTNAPNTYAAIDLGSNSFHMVVAQEHNGTMRIVDRLRESVRLRAGLDEYSVLSHEAQQRGLDCLRRFSQRLRNVPKTHYRAAATNTLRVAVNSAEFCQQAEAILGIPIHVIAGREEARLIYNGIHHHYAHHNLQRLVLDIGGGSTEFIIGRNQDPLLLESTAMGCISFTQRFFANGQITHKQFRAAEIQASLELQPFHQTYIQAGWEQAVGSSGTVKAIGRLMTEVVDLRDEQRDHITAEGLKALKAACISKGSIGALDFKTLSEARRANIVGGIAILRAVFKSFALTELRVSHAALREGLLYQMLGNSGLSSLRDRAVSAFQHRFAIDLVHAAQVESVVMQSFDKVAGAWQFNDTDRHALSFAARLHEAGLSVSHAKHHVHGQYLVSHADLLGFSISEQQFLALLVRYHRRKLPSSALSEFSQDLQYRLGRLIVLLRLAVVLCRDRELPSDVDTVKLVAKPDCLCLSYPEHWQHQYPLTVQELRYEAHTLSQSKVPLHLLDEAEQPRS